MIKTTDLFDLTHTRAKAYLETYEYPWQALPGIRDLILELGAQLGEDFTETAPQVWIHKTASIAPSASVAGPCIIGANTEVRHCAFIRGCALVGENCVVGNSVELKNAILFDGVQVPHFNYVGDSILGYMSHLGCGAVTSNFRSDKGHITLKNGNEKIETGLRKFGAMVGDFVEVGCNAVLNPGTVLGRNCQVYPTSCVRGVVPENSIWKNDGTMITKR